jgi:hypothetical protein
MYIPDEFESHLPAKLLKTFQSLRSPFLIQQYLDAMPYIGEERDRSPLNVMRDHQSHCLDGGFFAALALWRIGFKPLVIDLVAEPSADDDHVLALYQVEGRWGAVAKSNYVNLGFREPVHKSLRELAMTYFEHFINIRQEKTLRAYTRPFDVSRSPLKDWAWNEDSSVRLYQKFYRRRATRLITKKMAAKLTPIADRAYSAETLYTNLNESFGNRAEG